jgi:DNA invertase Pin-like site-specific DNA recombinase
LSTNDGYAVGGKTPAVAYLRVSGRGQIQGDGFPRQRAAIAAFAKQAGFHVLEEYRDEGVSGARELDGRPGLAALLDRVESNGVKLVLVERADRLARDLMVQEIILDQCKRVGVRVVAADGTDFSDDDPTRTLIRQVLGAVAQFEKSVLVAKLRAARVRKGVKVGVKPFGFYTGERQTVERLQELVRAGKGEARVAQILNSEGRPTRTGKPWAAGTIHGIIVRQRNEGDSSRRARRAEQARKRRARRTKS